MISPNLSISGLVIMLLLVFGGSLGLPGGALSIISVSSLASNFSNILIIIVLSYIAAVLGDLLAYELAFKLSDRFRNKLRKFSFFRNNELKAKELIDKRGFSIVFFTRFALLSLCPVISYLSGFEKMKRKKYYLAVISGELLYALIFPIIGFTVGEVINSLISAIDYLALAVLLLVLLFFIIKYYLSKKKSRKLHR
jgi:membrane protein DedA with SNARE-associated domain